ncbi:lipoamide dehydrogenase [Gammaproteobacteria bacterium]
MFWVATPMPELSQDGTELQTEVVVLGGGPGGYTAAFRAADLGRQVILVEPQNSLGGVCLQVGCIPSKWLLHVAKVMEEVKSLSSHGVVFGSPAIDLESLRTGKSKVVQKLTQGLSALAKQRKVRVVQGTGTFINPHKLEVKGTFGQQQISFQNAIIAVGSVPIQLPGLSTEDPRILDSTGALALNDIPKNLLVIGGGIIGLEMTTVYSALGSQVTVVEWSPTLLPGCDLDLVRPLQRRLSAKGVQIHLNTQFLGLLNTETLAVQFKTPKGIIQKTFDRILVAVGRKPNGADIGAETISVLVDKSGFIPVNAQQQTNVGHIYAIGDVTGQPMLAHKATHEGKVAAEVIAGHKSGFEARVIPNVAYTDPEVAWVGLTEIEAKSKGISYEKGAFPWAASGRALTLGGEEGLTKLLFDPNTKQLLGAGIVGPGAGELIAEAALAIEMSANAQDLALTIHPHPTLSETIAFSAEAFEGTLTDLYLPKKRR